MGVFEKHIGKGVEIEIEGETYELKPLDVEAMPYFFKAMKAFSGVKDNSSNEDVFKNLDDEGIDAVKYLVMETLKKSYPNEPIDELKVFGMKYMMNIFGKVMEMNSYQPTTHEAKKREKLMKRLGK